MKAWKVYVTGDITGITILIELITIAILTYFIREDESGRRRIGGFQSERRIF